MLVLIGYRKIKKIFRHHWRVIYTPIYKDIGKAKVKDKALKMDLKRET